MTRKFTEKKILIATHNKGKLEEFQQLLAPLGIECISARELNLPEPEETETTFLGNCRIKAHAAAKASGMPALADDSGLSVDALNGQPGVYTADWAETPNGRDFRMAMEKVHIALQEEDVATPHSAHFSCTLVLAWPDGHDEHVAGICEGELIWPIRGAEGHGYDPMFQPNGFEKTFAEMSSESKNAISHRAKALDKMLEKCFT